MYKFSSLALEDILISPFQPFPDLNLFSLYMPDPNMDKA